MHCFALSHASVFSVQWAAICEQLEAAVRRQYPAPTDANFRFKAYKVLRACVSWFGGVLQNLVLQYLNTTYYANEMANEHGDAFPFADWMTARHESHDCIKALVKATYPGG